MELDVLSVSALMQYVKVLFQSDKILRNVYVCGEISNYRPHHSGHHYFTLKDEAAQVKCVMFRSNGQRLKFTPDNGMHVIARGYFSLYERDGQMQLYVEDMKQEGLGALHIAFEKLKEKLHKEGLFDASYKKPLPLLPRKIGVVTSESGAVLRDIKTVVARRFPTEIVLAPALVQGADAPKSIVRALHALQNVPEVDVIIIARGGGSLEDLWPFNTEEVARAVFASKIPVISAVGHETDFTICDFVADVRAATPSHAAEMVVPFRTEQINNILHLQTRLFGAIKKLTEIKRSQLLAIVGRPVFKYPHRMLAERRQYIDFLMGKLVANLTLTYERKNAILKEKVARLEALSPLKVFARGYALCYDKDGRIIKSIRQLSKSEMLTVKVCDGDFDCSVINIRGDEDEKND